VHHTGRDLGRQGVAERAATPGAMDMAIVALDKFHVGPDDVLVDRDSSATGPFQYYDLKVAEFERTGRTASQ